MSTRTPRTLRNRRVIAPSVSHMAHSILTILLDVETGSSDPGQAALSGDWSAIDPVGLVLVALTGIGLLLVGGRLLRPAVVLAAASLGAVLGLRLAAGTREETLPDWLLGLGVPSLAWVAGLPLLAGLVSIFIARFVLAAMLGGATATVVLVLGLAIAGRGAPESAAVVRVSLLEFVQSGGDGFDDEAAGPSGGATSEVVTQAAVDAVSRSVSDRIEASAVGVIGDLSAMSPAIPGWIRSWWRTSTEEVPQATVDLVVAVASVSAICALLLGLLLPDRVAIVATSIAGAWLLSTAIAAAWSRFGSGSPPPPFPWLLGGGVLAGFGILIQHRWTPRTSKIPVRTDS
ncbi:MAG: hypothetical protein CMJ51_00490 [Planctomycetaceae bacterium]|nr:hypothetical protein [Planctomycetaceae bacterium]